MQNSNRLLIEAESIGHIAHRVLSINQRASAMGSTSKGIFVKTPGKWLLFISFEPFRGPLTITLRETGLPLKQLSAGYPIFIDSGQLLIPRCDVMVSTLNSQVWQPISPPLPPLGAPERRKRLDGFAKQVMSKKKHVGLSHLLPALLEWPGVQTKAGLGFKPDQADVSHIQASIRRGDPASLAKLLFDLLGAGQGLTPSADDFIVGLLLSLNRWKDVLWTGEGLEVINREIVGAAVQKTTTLSANLIECAALGQADERLITSLDWLMSGVERESEEAARLLEWGSSSGVDAFVGMAVASSAHG